MRGVDVSIFNKGIDLSMLKRLGYDFAIIRDGFGWGTPGKKDEEMESHYEAAKTAGMKVGFYHYIYDTTPSGAKQEALSALQHISGKTAEIFVAADIEEMSHLDLSSDILTDMVIEFAAEIRAAGYTPAVYSFVSLLNKIQWSRIPEDVKVWVAHWGVEKPGFTQRCNVWQHDVIGTTGAVTIEGSLPGVPGSLDLNILFDDTQSAKPVIDTRFDELLEDLEQLVKEAKTK